MWVRPRGRGGVSVCRKTPKPPQKEQLGPLRTSHKHLKRNAKPRLGRFGHFPKNQRFREKLSLPGRRPVPRATGGRGPGGGRDEGRKMASAPPTNAYLVLSHLKRSFTTTLGPIWTLSRKSNFSRKLGPPAGRRRPLPPGPGPGELVQGRGRTEGGNCPLPLQTRQFRAPPPQTII